MTLRHIKGFSAVLPVLMGDSVQHGVEMIVSDKDTGKNSGKNIRPRASARLMMSRTGGDENLV